MLLNDFYTIQSLEKTEDEINAIIQMDKDHAIFKGHFPGNPVTPGVCVMQIIKELTEKATDSALFMERSSNIKFKALINPEVNSVLSLQLKYKEADGYISVKNTTKFDDTVALTSSTSFKIV